MRTALPDPTLNPGLSIRGSVFSRYLDVMLAFGVIAVVALMIVRVPQWLVDVFIAVNMSVSALVLLVALYAQDARKLPSFPTVLLLTTLFRLALNVTTTRLILLEADAGHIITAFGEFVVGGNFVVGGVVFVVLTLIQFIVIAKGSERVAEVSARFTLDAMPGKQMSIDADLRSGALSQEQAKARRDDLARESKLYGAMDGAMKFVKGDAVASIIVAVVNIVGGILVGVSQQGMAFGEAAQLYSLLTIGDGLVAQIPALLISVSAGLVVTRVAASEDGGTQGNVARDLAEQVFGQVRPMFLVAGLLLLLGLMPGFPTWVFLGLAGAALAAGFVNRARAKSEVERGSESTGVSGGTEAKPVGLFEPPAIVLEVGAALEPLLTPDDSGAEAGVRANLESLVAGLSAASGVPFPPVTRGKGGLERADGYRFVFYGVSAAEGSIAPGQAVVLAPFALVKDRGVRGAEPFVLPWCGLEAACIPAEAVQDARQRSFTVLSADAFIAEHLRRMLLRRAAEFLGGQEVSTLLEQLKQRRPALVQSVQQQVKMHELTEILQRLVRERVPINDLRLVLGAVSRVVGSAASGGVPAGTGSRAPAEIAEQVRADLAEPLFASLCDSSRRLAYYQLTPEIEELIRDKAFRTAGGQVRLSPAHERAVVEALLRAVAPEKHIDLPPVLLVFSEMRAGLASLLKPRVPDLVVMDFGQVPAWVRLECVGIVEAPVSGVSAAG